ncbi:F-box/LRR-repeat protein 17, partial [Lamprotornis superbus]
WGPDQPGVVWRIKRTGTIGLPEKKNSFNEKTTNSRKQTCSIGSTTKGPEWSHPSFSRNVAQAAYAQRFNSKIITGDLQLPEADEDTLIAIGRYSMTIETVDVGWCKEITDRGATQIAQRSKSLRYLGLMRCDQVNEATVEQLVQQYPHITFSTVLQDCKRTLERAYQMGWTPNMSSGS